MRLLLDENLSRRIVPLLQHTFPETTQVALIGLERASDREVWEYSKAQGYAIVTKDDDFLGLLSVLGYPPKVVLLTIGNSSNEQVVATLVRHPSASWDPESA
jgi:predicted nuclease of predicted toxin-antitoxin system